MHHCRNHTPAILNRTTASCTWTAFLLLAIFLQQIQPHSCYHQVKRSYSKRLSHAMNGETPQSRAAADSLPADKRTLTSANGIGGSVSQPEEIFSANDQLESNYDEYPMVVPKRAALLLDRLMVALHHALEKEHSGSARLSDFYNKNNDGKNPPTSDKGKTADSGDASDSHDKGENNPKLPNRYLPASDSPYFTMYSDDDPSVMMDYDFKDLNSINRATGETLMAQSFQRRANMGLDLGGDVGMDGVSSLLSASSSAHGGGLISGVNSGDSGGGGRTNFGNNGRMYWRCYFNAVSCF